jgi:UTP:GlnB (protein PII) uridylyltransferase
VEEDNLVEPPWKRRSSVSVHRDTDATQVVVTADHEFVVIGANAQDRPGLLSDISKGLLRLNFSLHHAEAAVVGTRSISVWRCELMNSDLPDLEEIWSVINVSTRT